MCGIAGFIDFRKLSSQKNLQEMTDSLVHRGPDGRGQVLLELENVQIGLGHRRLAIIDTSENGAQPMQYSELTVTYNGEIYNFKEVREKLKSLGHSFTTESDTEVLLHAYQEWSEKCLDEFIGMFALVVYDAKHQTVFCARDRTGVKPFFYSIQNGLFLFGSELKALLAHPHFEKRLNKQAVQSFVQYGNIPSPHCIYEDAFKLKPGHFIKIDLTTNSLAIIRPIQYWSAYTSYNSPKWDMSFEEAKKETEKRLKKAFDYRMVADVPVGVFLSGGYDSAAVTSLLQKDATQKLKTFTIAVPDIGLNEAQNAKEVATHLGTDHQEMRCTEEDALQLVQELAHFYDEPFADSSALPTMLLSKWVKSEVTVALSADGGDELFAGYNRYDYLMRHGKKIQNIPSPLRKTIAFGMDKIPAHRLPYLKNLYNFPNRYEKLKGLLLDPSPEKMMWSLSRQWNDKQILDLFVEPLQPLADAYSSKQLKPEFYSPLSYMMAIDYETYLPDDIMQKVDRATMSASLEGREPFLDHELFEFVAKLPDQYKYDSGKKKYILKEIVHDYIPASMMDRPKMGFAIPIEKWMQQQLKPLVEDYLSNDRISQQGLFQTATIQQLRDDFLYGKTELGFKVWYILCFQMWYAKYMEN